MIETALFLFFGFALMTLGAVYAFPTARELYREVEAKPLNGLILSALFGWFGFILLAAGGCDPQAKQPTETTATK